MENTGKQRTEKDASNPKLYSDITKKTQNGRDMNGVMKDHR